MTDAIRTPVAREHSRLARRPSARERALLEAFPARELPHLMVRRVLGVGGTATVYEAFHVRLGLNVAVKVLSVRGEVAEEARTRMLREARLYATLFDARIPRVYDVNVLPDGRAYVVLELRSGTPLARMIGEGRALPTELSLHVARELLEPLAYLHGAGILHRDVTPANVLIDSSTTPPAVCLIDLGIAKSQTVGDADSVSVTRQGTLLGTPQYMAPERLIDCEADERSDIYAVGVLLYEMLTGESAFQGNTPAEVVAAVLRDAPTDLATRVPSLSARVVHAVERAMAREPADRFQTAAEMLGALREGSGVLRRPESSSVLPSEPDVRVIDPQRSGKLMVLAAVVIGLLLIGLWTFEERASVAASGAARSIAAEPEAAREVPVEAAPVPQPVHADPAAVHADPAAVDAPAAAHADPDPAPREGDVEDRAEARDARRARRARTHSARDDYEPAARRVEPARDVESTRYVAPVRYQAPPTIASPPARQTPAAVPENPYENVPENPYQ